MVPPPSQNAVGVSITLLILY